jgi:hypothetical protein
MFDLEVTKILEEAAHRPLRFKHGARHLRSSARNLRVGAGPLVRKVCAGQQLGLKEFPLHRPERSVEAMTAQVRHEPLSPSDPDFWMYETSGVLRPASGPISKASQ